MFLMSRQLSYIPQPIIHEVDSTACCLGLKILSLFSLCLLSFLPSFPPPFPSSPFSFSFQDSDFVCLEFDEAKVNQVLKKMAEIQESIDTIVHRS